MLDMEQQCFKGRHLTLTLTLGVVGLVVGVLLPPIAMLTLLSKRRGSKLYDPSTKLVFLFLYHSYQDEHFYWEGAKMIFILALVCVRVLGRGLPDLYRMAIFLILLQSFLLLLMSLRPHRFPTIHYLEVVSLGLNLLATYLIMFTLFDPPTAAQPNFSQDSEAFRAVVIIMGCLFVIYAAVLLAWMASNLYRNQKDRLRKLAAAVGTGGKLAKASVSSRSSLRANA